MNILTGYTQIQLQKNFQTGKEWNMPDISQHPWKCTWTTTSLRPQREPNSIFKTKPLNKAVQHTAFYQNLLPAMQNSHQAWKIHQFSQGTNILQGKEKNMDTGTFTLGNIILNRYPAPNTLTHQATEPGRVQQNFQQLKMESSKMEALPCFNYSAETTPQMETSKKGPRGRLNPKWKRHNSHIQSSNSNGSNPVTYQRMYLNNECTLPG